MSAASTSDLTISLSIYCQLSEEEQLAIAKDAHTASQNIARISFKEKKLMTQEQMQLPFEEAAELHIAPRGLAARL